MQCWIIVGFSCVCLSLHPLGWSANHCPTSQYHKIFLKLTQKDSMIEETCLQNENDCNGINWQSRIKNSSFNQLNELYI